MLKTDNGPAYLSKPFAKFCNPYHIDHHMGIPYNPQGQALIELVNKKLKFQVEKLKGEDGRYLPTPQNQLNSALYTLKCLNCKEQGFTAAERHCTNSTPQPKARVIVEGCAFRNLERS